jgi:hypothetical protein
MYLYLLLENIKQLLQKMIIFMYLLILVIRGHKTQILSKNNETLSASGQYQTAVAYYGYYMMSPDSLDPDFIYFSKDFGVTWKQSNSLQKILVFCFYLHLDTIKQLLHLMIIFTFQLILVIRGQQYLFHKILLLTVYQCLVLVNIVQFFYFYLLVFTHLNHLHRKIIN